LSSGTPEEQEIHLIFGKEEAQSLRTECMKKSFEILMMVQAHNTLNHKVSETSFIAHHPN